MFLHELGPSLKKFYLVLKSFHFNHIIFLKFQILQEIQYILCFGMLQFTCAVTDILQVNFDWCKINWNNLWVSGLSIVIACILAKKLILKLLEVVVIPPRDVRLKVLSTKLSTLVRRDFISLVQFVNLVCFSGDQGDLIASFGKFYFLLVKCTIIFSQVCKMCY